MNYEICVPYQRLGQQIASHLLSVHMACCHREQQMYSALLSITATVPQKCNKW